MNLYDLNYEIENFQFEFDEETGEVLNIDDLDDLKMEKNKKIENLALYIKNINAEKECIKKEIENFQKRLKTKENKIIALTNYLENILNGEKFETPKVNISYRSSTTVKVDDEKRLIEYAKDKNLKNLYIIKHEEKVDKREIKKYFKDNKLPYCHLEKNKKISIK